MYPPEPVGLATTTGAWRGWSGRSERGSCQPSSSPWPFRQPVMVSVPLPALYEITLWVVTPVAVSPAPGLKSCGPLKLSLPDTHWNAYLSA